MKSFTKISIPHYILLGFTFLSASCSYSPGLHVSPIANDVVENGSDNRMPTYFMTNLGVKVKLETLTAYNLPKPKGISKKRHQAIQALLRYQNVGDYRLSPSDVLSVNLWAYPEIMTNKTNTYPINYSGNIYLPLIGTVNVQDRTISDVNNELSYRYSKYLKQSDIQATVVKYKGKAYAVNGEVIRPGQYYFDDTPTTLMSAIGKAGGLLKTANMHAVNIERNGKNYEFGLMDLKKMGVPLQNIQIKKGDTLTIGSNIKRKVFLIGEAGQPNAYTIPEDGMSLANVLGEGRGVRSNTASASKIYVLRNKINTRGNADMSHVYRLDLSQIENIALANRFQMQPNDTVYIDATGLTRWNRILSLLTPSANAVRTGQVIGNN